MAQDDVQVPRTLEIGEHTLVLNGSGIRRQVFVDVYLACLYVSEHGGASDRILEADQPQAITLHMTSNLVNSKRLEKTALDGLKQSTNGDLESIRTEVEKLREMFSTEVSKGDVITLAYLPDQGVLFYHNGQFMGTIEGRRFKRALFGIWLSDRPVQKSLKRDLLGDPENDPR